MNISAAQAESIRSATSTATYSDGANDFLVVITRLGNEDDPVWMDIDWVPYISEVMFPEWYFIDGDGGDGQGPWFAAWSRLNESDPGIWVALARRPHYDAV